MLINPDYRKTRGMNSMGAVVFALFGLFNLIISIVSLDAKAFAQTMIIGLAFLAAYMTMVSLDNKVTNIFRINVAFSLNTIFLLLHFSVVYLWFSDSDYFREVVIGQEGEMAHRQARALMVLTLLSSIPNVINVIVLNFYRTAVANFTSKKALPFSSEALDSLKKLSELKEAGAISEEEFLSAKQKVLE